MSAVQPTLPLRSVMALYCVVQFGKTVLWVAADLVAFYILAVVEHVAADRLALVLMGGLGWHAISDHVVGRWLEERRGNARLLAVVAGCAVPVASIAFVLSLLMAARMPWVALGAMMICRTAYALFDVPHQTLIGRMARRGYPALKVVALRNLWGQVAALTLGLGLVPVLGPAMSGTRLGLVLWGIAAVSAILSLPVVNLILRLWDTPAALPQETRLTAARSEVAVITVLALHFTETMLVTTASKLIIGTISPGIALATISIGRIVASIPLPTRWRDRELDKPLAWSVVLLIASIMISWRWPGPSALVLFGFAAGWINLLTWAWLGRTTDHPRIFGAATMLTKIALLLSIPVAARSVD